MAPLDSKGFMSLNRLARRTSNATETVSYAPSLPLTFRIAEAFDLAIEGVFVSPSTGG